MARVQPRGPEWPPARAPNASALARRQRRGEAVPPVLRGRGRWTARPAVPVRLPWLRPVGPPALPRAMAAHEPEEGCGAYCCGQCRDEYRALSLELTAQAERMHLAWADHIRYTTDWSVDERPSTESNREGSPASCDNPCLSRTHLTKPSAPPPPLSPSVAVPPSAAVWSMPLCSPPRACLSRCRGAGTSSTQIHRARQV